MIASLRAAAAQASDGGLLPDGLAIRVAHLTKAFGAVTAVNDVSFEVPPGQTFALLGPHGSGKSTMVRMLCTLTRPTAGVVRVKGFDVVTRPREVRRRIGLVLHDQPTDTDMTAEESLRFHAVLYGVEPDDMERRIDILLEQVGLSERAGERTSGFGRVSAKRHEIARALLNAPDVLFLDEPTDGWDAVERMQLWTDVRRLSEEMGLTIFVTTRYPDEAQCADRIAILDKGRIVTTGSASELKAIFATTMVNIATADDARAFTDLTDSGFDVTSIPEGLRIDSGKLPGGLAGIIAGTAVPIRQMHVHQPSLEDVLADCSGRVVQSNPGERYLAPAAPQQRSEETDA